MNKERSLLASNLMQLAEAALIELPAAATLRLFNREDEKALGQVGWRVYESAVGVCGAAVNAAYATPAVNRASANIFDSALRVQRLADAVTGAFFKALWPSIGLPDAADIAALRADVKELREELRSAVRSQESALSVLAAERNSKSTSPMVADPNWPGWDRVPAKEVA